MSLTPGTRLGRYEIIAPLGSGGMGEVWRALDTRLDREVALKFLPEDFAADPDRQARLEREAKVLASLNHPHIATLYGLERADGRYVLVMELVEGEDLAERLSRGPIPVEDAIPMARQVADALEAAHERGVVHRDLKPANVKVRPDGTVKVLDFGLAKAYRQDDSGVGDADPAHSPTLTAAATQAGIVLGTAAYMSPEQARGKAVDKRADIWAFGTVLYEMLTGRRLFAGETVSDTLAAVLRQEVDLDRLPAAVPPAIRRLLARCLERDPRRRLRDIGEARIALELPGDALATAPVARRRSVPRWALAGAAGVVLAAAVVAAFRAGREAASGAAEDLTITGLTFRRGSVLTARFAPDGRTVVYAASWDGAPSRIFSLRIGSREVRTLGLPGADVLAVSSTGELAVSLGRRFTVGWEGAGTLARMAMDGGAPREILEGVQDADWSPDGASLAVARDLGAKRRLEYPIGHVLYETGGWVSHPRVSRDGRLVAFLDHPERGDNQASVKVVDLDGAVRQVAPTAFNGLAWTPAGDDLVYPTGAALLRSTLSGRARVIFRIMGSIFLHDISTDGSALVSQTTMQREIVGMAPGATAERNLSWLDWSFPAAISEDGRTVLFQEGNTVSAEGDYALFLRSTDGGPPVRLGDGRAYAISRDGKWVLAATHIDRAPELLVLPTGPGQTRSLGRTAVIPSAAAFLPDGARAVVAAHTSGEGMRLHVLDISSGTLRPISPQGIADYFCDMVSPDGRLAFATGPDGALTLYPIDAGDPHTVPGTSLDDIPIRWSADGRAVFVQRRSALQAAVDRVDVATGARTPWKELVPPDPAGVQGIGPIQISGDGRSYVYSYRRKLDQLFIVTGLH